MDKGSRELLWGVRGRQGGGALTGYIPASNLEDPMSVVVPPISSHPDILGGTPVFTGTRVPVDVLFQYLEAGDSLDRFLEQHPTVDRDQAVAALELARGSLTAGARPA